jgi:hypothetical protein
LPHIYFKENNGLAGLNGLTQNLKRIYRKKLTKDYLFDDGLKFLKNILLPSNSDNNDNSNNKKSIIASVNDITSNDKLLIHDQVDLNEVK